MQAMIARLALGTPDEMADAVADFVVEGCIVRRQQLITEYELMVESARRPALQEATAGWLRSLRAQMVEAMIALGSSNPDIDARLLLAVISGFEVDSLADQPGQAQHDILRAILCRSFCYSHNDFAGSIVISPRTASSVLLSLVNSKQLQPRPTITSTVATADRCIPWSHRRQAKPSVDKKRGLMAHWEDLADMESDSELSDYQLIRDETETNDADLSFDEALIRRIRIVGLFRRYNYDLEVPPNAPSRMLLLYGDNGVGKTNILRLVWHLLSPSDNRGHRQSLAKQVFKELHLHLSDGSIISVTKLAATSGPYKIGITGRVEVPATEWPQPTQLHDWPIDVLNANLATLPKELRPEAQKELGQKSFIDYLRTARANPLFLADDRNIYSDEVDVGSVRRDRDEARRLERGSAARNYLPDDTQSLVAREAASAIRRANEYLRSLTLGGTTIGSASANSVYLEVLLRLGTAAAPSTGTPPLETRDALADRIRHLSLRSANYERLSLVAPINSEAFLEYLDKIEPSRVSIAEEVLNPYLTSLEARLDALKEAQGLIATFLEELNGFFSDKYVYFSPREGLRIAAKGGSDDRLTADQLSSGERQLMLLLCNALLAGRQGSRLFLIDEPELSLNAKWQRRIGDALLNVSEGTPTQFVVATHSIEMLSKFRESVVSLRPEPFVE